MMFQGFHLRKIKILFLIFLCNGFIIFRYGIDATEITSYLAKAFNNNEKSENTFISVNNLSRTKKIDSDKLKTSKTKNEKIIVCEGHVKIEEFNYEFISVDTELTKYEDEGYGYAEIKLKNTGVAPWYGENTKCKNKVYLGSQAEQDRESIFWTNYSDSNWVIDNYKNRIMLMQDEVKPGETASFVFKVNIPEKDGIYREFFAPVFPNVGWINHNIYIDFNVGSISDEDKEKISIANLSSSTANFDGEKNIEVDLSIQTMFLRYGEERFYKLLVSSGNPYKYPTPKANWTVVNKQELRTSGRGVPYKMPFWLGLSQEKYGFRGYGLHGLPYLLNSKGYKYWDEKDEPGMHLGRPVSHGCVRMAPGSDELVWNWTDIGTKVWTH